MAGLFAPQALPRFSALTVQPTSRSARPAGYGFPASPPGTTRGKGDLPGSSILHSTHAAALYPGCPDRSAPVVVLPAPDPCHLREVGRTPIVLRGHTRRSRKLRPTLSLSRNRRGPLRGVENHSHTTGQASPLWVTPPRLAATTCRTGNYMTSSFHLARRTRLILAHQRSQRKGRWRREKGLCWKQHPITTHPLGEW